ncbi:conserved oligomeric Golgi complex subunit 7-like [Oscarella lobularis]|uniref:conserved oligomeric Golgi complex subunit 7-like n=1 Tax=Oscarella lobularis TaxID=121494 RepID=UPI0033134371
MDFSKFSHLDFDVKEWVNGALRAPRDANTSLDVHASTLVLKLQLFIQEVNKSLEEISQQAVQNVPRIVKDVETVKHEATLLKDQMQLVKEDIKQVEENTSQSMKTLMELDKIKCRMQETAQALREADNWTSLSANVEEILETDDILAIYNKLLGMQKSLTVLHDVPDYANRHQKLESLKNKLESKLSPRLVAAFNSHNLDEAKYYVEIFRTLKREEQLQFYYIRTLKNRLCKFWQKLQSLVGERPLQEQLIEFLDEVVSMCHSELSWGRQVFSEPSRTLCSVLIQILNSLDPSIEHWISQHVPIPSLSNSLSLLIDVKQALLRFARSLELIFSDHEQAGLNEGDVSLLRRAIHGPLVQFQLDYSKMEQDRLLIDLGAINLEAQGLTDTVTLVADSIPRLFNAAEESIDRCLQFTQGLGCCGLVQALEAFFSMYCGRLESALVDVRSSRNVENASQPQGTASGFRDDWSYFQNAFRFLECCGSVLFRFSKFESDFLSVFSTKASHIGTPSRVSAVEGSVNLQFFNYLLERRPTEYQQVVDLVYPLESVAYTLPLLPESRSAILAFNKLVHDFAFDSLFSGLQTKLFEVPRMEAWKAESSESAGLATFTVSPLTYITQIGDHLLTLPQQLEPFVSQEYTALDTALRATELPYSETPVSVPASPEHEMDIAESWIGAITNATMKVYFQKILEIDHFSHHGAQQLSTDIEYFCNVLSALEVLPNVQLKQLAHLLRVHPEQYESTAADQDISPALYRPVARARGIEL